MNTGGALLALVALLAIGFASPAGAVPLAADGCAGDDCEPGCLLCLCCPRAHTPLLDRPGAPPAELPSLAIPRELAPRPPGAPVREILHVPWTSAVRPF